MSPTLEYALAPMPGVWGTATAWPDLIVAAVMAGIFPTSSVQILWQPWAEHREGTVAVRPATRRVAPSRPFTRHPRGHWTPFVNRP